MIAMDDPKMRDRAADLGTAIGQDGGVLAAVRFIESRVAR